MNFRVRLMRLPILGNSSELFFIPKSYHVNYESDFSGLLINR